MPTMSLVEMLQGVSRIAEIMFADEGEISPMWFGQRADGVVMVVTPPSFDNKNTLAAILRNLFKKEDIVRYVSVMEMWTLMEPLNDKTLNDMRAQRTDSIAEHPERREGICFIAEDSEKMITGTQMIQRLPDGKGILEPLVLLTPTEVHGRFNGLLPGEHPSN